MPEMNQSYSTVSASTNVRDDVKIRVKDPQGRWSGMFQIYRLAIKDRRAREDVKVFNRL